MAIQSVMIKNKPYDDVRLTIVGSQSGTYYYHYSEAQGTRYFVNEIGNPTSSMDSVTFKAHLTFTSSGTQSWGFNLIPMNVGETALLDTKISAINSGSTKGYIMSSFGGYRHSGTTLTAIGGGISYSTTTDFTGASASFSTTATASIDLIVKGEVGEVIDWDIHISYTKGYHRLVTSGGGGGWYPDPPQG